MTVLKEDISIFLKVLLGIYVSSITGLLIYALHKLVNIFRAMWYTRVFTDKPKKGGLIERGNEPLITIQICAYNEAAVVEETIDAACNVDWPRDKLVVQILDDSNDETSDIIEEVSARWREKGTNCYRLTRPNRTGYKAGSLHANTKNIKSDFVAMFDSDHRCHPDFLRRAVPHFFNDEGSSKDDVGLVQCPWAFYNIHTNWLTEYDAFALDVSHVVEQTARSEALNCFSFNGTGGIWRTAAIAAGGGWQWDTLTEDLDLSYLAHLRGYKFVYLRDVPQQLEVPSGYFAHKGQKHRWTKGFFQVARKSLLNIMRNPQSSLGIKIEAFFHMTGALNYLFCFMAGIILPILYYHGALNPFLITYSISPIFPQLLAMVCTVYGKPTDANGHYDTFFARTARLFFLPIVFSMSMGMMIYEIRAMYDGLTSNDATFVRTPKEGKKGASEDADEDEDEDGNEDEDSEENTENDIERGGPCKTIEDIQAAKKLKKKLDFMKEITFGVSGLVLGLYFMVIPALEIKSYLFGSTGIYNLLQSLVFLFPASGLLLFHGKVLRKIIKKKLRELRAKHAASKKDQEMIRETRSFDNLLNEKDWEEYLSVAVNFEEEETKGEGEEFSV